jgi:tricorn protease
MRLFAPPAGEASSPGKDSPRMSIGARSRRRTQILARTGAVKIENTGVEPDITVENMPNATFKGGVAQLDAAIGFLLEKLKTDPVKRL